MYYKNVSNNMSNCVPLVDNLTTYWTTIGNNVMNIHFNSIEFNDYRNDLLII